MKLDKRDKRRTERGVEFENHLTAQILQMSLLEPSLCVLDETDSGLDIDALKIVADGVNALRSPDRAIVVITHYQRLLDYIVPDQVHVLYKGQIIKEYFLNYETWNSDFTVTLGDHQSVKFHGGHLETGWQVTVADTGLETMTGGRVKRVERYVDSDTFMVTYGDGLADVNLEALLAFHRNHGKIATVTGGHSYTAQTAASVVQIYKTLGSSIGRTHKRVEITNWFALAAAGLLAAAVGAAALFESRG